MFLPSIDYNQSELYQPTNTEAKVFAYMCTRLRTGGSSLHVRDPFFLRPTFLEVFTSEGPEGREQ